MLGSASRYAGELSDAASREPSGEGFWRSERRLFVFGMLSLGSGVLVYAVARPAGTIPFLPHISGVSASVPRSLNVVIGALPTFSHAFAFALMTASLVGPGQTSRLFGCAAWTCTEMVFELAQYPVARGWLLEHWAGAASSIPALGRYLRGSTFDSYDLLAAAVGGLLAGVVVWADTSRRTL
jgi:hypothetical protein